MEPQSLLAQSKQTHDQSDLVRSASNDHFDTPVTSHNVTYTGGLRQAPIALHDTNRTLHQLYRFVSPQNTPPQRHRRAIFPTANSAATRYTHKGCTCTATEVGCTTKPPPSDSPTENSTVEAYEIGPPTVAGCAVVATVMTSGRTKLQPRLQYLNSRMYE